MRKPCWCPGSGYAPAPSPNSTFPDKSFTQLFAALIFTRAEEHPYPHIAFSAFTTSHFILRKSMRSFARGIAAVMLFGGLIGCADGPLDPLREDSPAARTTALRDEEVVVVADPGEPGVTVNSGECTFEHINDGSEEGSWVSTCEGISGGPTLPPPLPPPPLAPSFPPPPPMPEISGGGGGDGTGAGGSGEQTSPVCAIASLSWVAAMTAEGRVQAKYQDAYDAYIVKRAEYIAWDNQAKADNVYTAAEQAELIRLGDQMRVLETAMNAAKTEYDDANKLQKGLAAAMATACAFGI